MNDLDYRKRYLELPDADPRGRPVGGRRNDRLHMTKLSQVTK